MSVAATPPPMTPAPLTPPSVVFGGEGSIGPSRGFDARDVEPGWFPLSKMSVGMWTAGPRWHSELRFLPCKDRFVFAVIRSRRRVVSTLGRALELVSKFTGLPVPTSPFNLEGESGSAGGDDVAMPGKPTRAATRRRRRPQRRSDSRRAGDGVRDETRRYEAIRRAQIGAPRRTSTGRTSRWTVARSRGRPRVAHVRGAHVRGGLRRRRRAGLQESAVRRRAARHRGEGDDRSRSHPSRRRDAILRRCFEQIREARQARAASPEGEGTKAERLPGRRRRGFKAQGGDGSLIIPRGCGG